MRSSSVVLALAAAAAVTPAFAAPVSSTYSSQQTTGSDESGAVKLGNIADVASIGSSVVSVLHNLFGGSSNQQRRDELEVLLARAQNELDESGAISFDTIKNIGSIGGSAISILHNLFGGSNNQQRDVQDESGAVKLGNIADVASIGSSVVSVLHNLFGGSGNQQRRDELEALFARAQNELDESGAISFDTIKNIGSIGGSAISILHNLFGGSSNNQQRDVSDDSGALKLGDAANIASIGSSVVSVFHNLFGGNNKREFEELLARQDTGLSQSDAIKLGTLSTIFSVGAPVIGGIIDHFKNNGNPQQRRELEELFARQSDIDQSDAIKLGTLGTIFSVGAPIIGGIIDHFKNGDQQQRRELEELFARQSDIDQSDAIKLGTLGTIFSVGAPIIGGIIDHFKNGDQQQRRELEELFARGDESAALNTLFNPFLTKGPVLNSHTFGVPKFNIARQETDVDQSDAIKLGTLGTIFSVGAPIIGGIIDHFKNGDQQQRRELEELFARQSDIDQSDAIKLGTLGTIFSVGAPIIGGIIDHFKGNDNQRREFEELLARGDTSGALSTLLPAFRNRPPFRVGIPVFPTRSLNELD